MKNLAWALVAIVLIATGSVAHGQDKPRERTISVTGRGFVEVTPDQMTIQVGVQSTASTVEAARRENDASANAILKTLKDAGIADSDIQTKSSNLTRQYTPADQSKTRREQINYTIDRNFSVLLRKIAAADDILSALLKAGANSVSDVTFVDSKQKEHQDTALALAAADSIRLADFLALKYNAKRGKVLTITPPDAQDVMQNLQRSVQTIGTRDTSHDLSVPFVAGSIKVEASVTARFELE